MKSTNVLAFDFGASSGRLIMGSFDGNKITLKEIHRFPNFNIRIGERIYWDHFRIFNEMKIGLKKANEISKDIKCMAVDTWGVDYVVLDKEDNIIGLPICYRDSRTENSLKEIEEKGVSLEKIYSKTGIQNMNFNTIYQLHSDLNIRKSVIREGDRLLFTPDFFNFLLTNKKTNEYTISSTSAMLDAKNRTWDKELLEEIGLPHNLLGEIVKPGTIIGELREDIKEELELGSIKVAAVGCHDTASAVAGTPLEEGGAYLSCGTWSLLGVELKDPILTKEAMENEFTNEGGVFDTIRFLTNINGSFILQEIKRIWCRDYEEIDFPDIIREAKNAKNKNFIIDPKDNRFMAPLNMVEEIKNALKESGEGEPEGLGEIAIAAYNGLTGVYKESIEKLEKVLGRKINTINMVGGGTKDSFLCSLTAEKTGKKVITGPIEASVLGNVAMQLVALGELNSLEEVRKVIRNSSEIKEYNFK